MVAGSFSVEIDFSVETKRLWNAMVDIHNILPKQAPRIFAGVTLLQGDGGVGTIRQIDFTSACNKSFTYMKERVDEVDEKNLAYSFSLVEGGALGTMLASVQYHVKVSPKSDGGCIVIYTCNYDSLPGIPHDEAKLEEFKSKGTRLFNSIEAYLIANPTSYC